MYLLVTATELEMAPLRARLASCAGVEFLVAGVGMLETAVHLGQFLARRPGEVAAVVNLGVAGAFVGTGAALLDLCLAEREVLGDFGICANGTITSFSGDTMATDTVFPLDDSLRARAEAGLVAHGFGVRRGTFVTVNCVSGTERRGAMLRDRHQALCENMEGAAVTRLCRLHAIPALELRAVSNLVEDRDPSRWRLAEAVDLCAEAAGVLIPHLTGRP